MLAQRRLPSRDLNISVWPVVGTNQADAPENLFNWNIVDRLRVFRKIAQGTVQIAALSNLQRHTTDCPALPGLLIRSG
jgi:hypothetical protein